MPNITIRFTMIMFTALFAMAEQTLSQSDESRKLDLARSYEESGDFRESARLYQELYAKNKQNEEYFDGVVRTLLALDQPSSLLPLVSERSKLDASVELISLLASLQWRTGKMQDAETTWESALSTCGSAQDCFQVVAQSQARLRLYEKAITTLQKARKLLNAPALFADELSQYYTITGNITLGTEEILRLYQSSKNLGIAQGRLSALMLSKEANTYIGQVLESTLSANPDDYNLMMLQLWYYRESKQYKKALIAAQNLDERTRSQGRELLNFAILANKENEPTIAIEAFTKVMEFGKKSPYFATALYGYASGLEKKLILQETVTKEQALEIIEKYNDIIQEFPENQIIEECQFRIAQIYHNHVFDSDKSLAIIESILANKNGSNISANAALFAGDIELERGNTQQAKKYYEQIAKLLSRAQQKESDKAKFSLAMMEYYQGRTDSAKTLLALLASKTESDIAKDELSFIMLFEDNEDTPVCLQLYGKMEYARIRKDIKDLEQFYKQIEGACPKSDILEKATLEYAKSLYFHRRFSEAESILRRFVLEYDESIYGDVALSLLGDVLKSLSNNDEALLIYNQLLSKYPRSILLQDTREKIRKLRGA
ncbi:MAG: tetratricopeptide repeat protein [Candidatus Kapaibacterium sp.]